MRGRVLWGSQSGAVRSSASPGSLFASSRREPCYAPLRPWVCDASRALPPTIHRQHVLIRALKRSVAARSRNQATYLAFALLCCCAVAAVAPGRPSRCDHWGGSQCSPTPTLHVHSRALVAIL
jgi:hypothetical protein